MDVPFVSSGAMSRAQYALVRRVESAVSPQAADQILLNELDVLHRNLQQPHLSIEKCKEYLILILYCTISLSAAVPGDLEFALPHAVNLAELGQSPMDKRIGYIFCVELMPPKHDLQLMLINTLRKGGVLAISAYDASLIDPKDLESTSVPRICLALDVLTQIPNEDAIPSVDTRLQILLRHQSVTVRRRALAVYHTLFQRDTERLALLEDVIQRHLRTDPSGITSIATVTGKIKDSGPLGRLLNYQLQHQYRESGEPNSVLAILRTLRKCEVKLEPGSIPVVLGIIRSVSKFPMRAVLREAFMLLSTVSPEELHEFRSSSTAVASIRHLLPSRDPNNLYLFLCCLSCLDPNIWAGTHPNTVAALDEWEVQEIMKLLDSPDGLIRKMTLKILYSVDPVIVETYYSQALHNLSPSLTLSDKSEYVLRLLETIDLQDANDIDQYARHLKNLFSVVEGKEHGPTESLPVLDRSVQQILNVIREREASSRISCITALAVCLTEPDVCVGPTLMVVVSALVSEYCGKIPIPPVEMLRGIATRLVSYAPSVQEACLLTMLRLSVECDEIPEEVTAVVHQLLQHTGTYIRRRCDQFLMLSTQRRILAEIVSKAPSSSLPDFLFALGNYQSTPNITSPQSPRVMPSEKQGLMDFSPSRGKASARKLRYKAYGAPQPVPSLRYPSSPRQPKGSVSSQEDTGSSSRASDASDLQDVLVKTITPGELTLAAARGPFNEVETGRKLEPVAQQPHLDDLGSRVDLITLDSLFIAEPANEMLSDTDFQAAWDSMENASVRGWCEASLDMIVRLLQSLQYRMRVIAIDQPPFEGELKVLVQGPEPQQHATLRLREGDDESCLWRLRCSDLGLRASIKRLMEGI